MKARESGMPKQDAGFQLLAPGIVDLPPYHYGMALQRPQTGREGHGR